MEKKDKPTAQAILDVAQRLCQERGFNGFSFRDLSESLGIKSSSVHYHFATKEDLGEALVKRYRDSFIAQLGALDVSHFSGQLSAAQQLKAFAQAIGGLLEEHPRMCLCGMLASDRDTLPERVRRAVTDFFLDTERWLEGCIRRGISEGSIAPHNDPALLAQMMMAGLQGLVLCARAHGDRSRFAPGAQWLLQSTGVLER